MKKWDEIRKNSKIVLENDTIFNGFEGDEIIPKGVYYITGFWATVCGVATSLSRAQQCINDYVFASISLKKFKGII